MDIASQYDMRKSADDTYEMKDASFLRTERFEFEGSTYLRFENVFDAYTSGDLNIDIYYDVAQDRFFGDVMEDGVWRDLTDDEVKDVVNELPIPKPAMRLKGTIYERRLSKAQNARSLAAKIKSVKATSISHAFGDHSEYGQPAHGGAER